MPYLTLYLLRDLCELQLKLNVNTTRPMFSHKHCIYTQSIMHYHNSVLEPSISGSTLKTDDNEIPFQLSVAKPTISLSKRRGSRIKAYTLSILPHNLSVHAKSHVLKEFEFATNNDHSLSLKNTTSKNHGELSLLWHHQVTTNKPAKPSPGPQSHCERQMPQMSVMKSSNVVGDGKKMNLKHIRGISSRSVKSSHSFHAPVVKKILSQGSVAKSEVGGSNTPRRYATENTNPRLCHKNKWQIQKRALKEKFGSKGWMPRKRLSPDALEGIRALHAQHPEKYSTPVLAEQFKVSPEAIRRILKSKWRPSKEEKADRLRRWDKRGESIWSQMVEVGIKPPKKWREMGISGPQDFRSAQGKLESNVKALSVNSQSLSIELKPTQEEVSNDLFLSNRIL